MYRVYVLGTAIGQEKFTTHATIDEAMKYVRTQLPGLTYPFEVKIKGVPPGDNSLMLENMPGFRGLPKRGYFDDLRKQEKRIQAAFS